jgi:hypothetical protein
LLTSVDIRAIADEKAAELLAGPPNLSWAACAAIWSRVFVLAGPGWERAPETAGAMREAFSLAMQRASGMGAFVPNEQLVATLEAFDVEDDGSDEWQWMIYLMGIVQIAVRGKALNDCLRQSLESYLEGWFYKIGRIHGAAAGRPLRLTEANEIVAGDADWAGVVAFVRSL